MRRKVLLITPRFPFPPVSGGEKWISELSKGLAQEHELSLFTFMARGAETHQAALAMSMEGRLFKKVFLLKRPEPEAIAINRRYMPVLAAGFWSTEAGEEVARAAAEAGAEIAHINFSEMACYVNALPAGLPSIYTEHDSSYLYPWKYYLRETAGLKGFLKIGEYVKVRAYARRYYGRFSGVTFLTASDGRDIKRYVKTASTAVTPNAVRHTEFAAPSGTVRNPGEILFIGHYPHFPNEDAALRLARGIVPRLKARYPAARLTLAGSYPTPTVRALAGPETEIPGTVPDIRPFLWRAEIFAAPVRYGFGAKGKILEAFAAGLPVVASREAAAGIEGAEAGKHLLAASGEADFARLALRLL
ncbi:MAG TPA: hypothetical protein DIS59_03550, partial [Candidatus Magasanikbacteria bacterium]|nr:hypothetical protein [Candidatus Magasanikbacteria bacterium]